MLPNGFEFFEVALAACRAEARFLPVNWHLKAEELAYLLDDSGALPVRLNAGMVIAERSAGEDLRALLELHVRHTGSARAAALLEDWQRSSALFWRVLPRASAEGAVEDGALQIASA